MVIWVSGGLDMGFANAQPYSTTSKKTEKRDTMKNPFGDQKLPGSYHNLQERMYKKVSANVNDQILGILQKAYENVL